MTREEAFEIIGNVARADVNGGRDFYGAEEIRVALKRAGVADPEVTEACRVAEGNPFAAWVVYENAAMEARSRRGRKIRTLRALATLRRDADLVELCDRALEGNPAAVRLCLGEMSRAQDL